MGESARGDLQSWFWGDAELSFAPPGLADSTFFLPTACAVGCILSPLRGLAYPQHSCDGCHGLGWVDPEIFE